MRGIMILEFGLTQGWRDRGVRGACHCFARSLNLSPKGGSKTLTVLLPFAHDWETGVGMRAMQGLQL